MAENVPHIGTLREKPLHASLKRWCARPGDRIEVPIDRYVIDLVRDDELLIEIQTAGFASMKQKLRSLLDQGFRVRVVHPIPVRKWIVKVDDEGVEISRRRSPKRGEVTDVFAELVSIPRLVTEPGFEIEVVLIEEEEIRRHTPGKSWRRKGWSVAERRLLEVGESVRLASAADLAALLPETLADRFTTADLSQHLGKPRRAAQQMAYCLRHVEAIREVAREGNAIVYERVEA